MADKAAEGKIQQADVARAIAWTQKQLVFKAATLTEVAEEFNRYNQRQLIVQRPGALRVSHQWRVRIDRSGRVAGSSCASAPACTS